jgi:hypothetical protein
MTDPAAEQLGKVHDETLIDWFLSLDPGERLAELDSRPARWTAPNSRA